MRQYFAEFCKRGLLCCSGGPLVLAVAYGVMSATDATAALAPTEVCIGILSVTVMAFIAAGITMIYQVEHLPLISAILIHGGVLYLDYLLMYLLNSWIPRNWTGVGYFTVIFLIGYILIWCCIYVRIRAKAKQLTKKLPK